MVFMEGTYLRTRDPVYHQMTRFWSRIFAVNFAMGVATGIVMEFQFGTNWAAYSRFVGDIFGSALAAEGIFAFFLESGFLAVLIFGWDRVSPPMHFFATVMVALGSIFSAVWIIVANSWQHTPAGYHLVTHDGVMRAEITDFWAMVFNPSSMPRLLHTLLGAFVLGSFFVMSITAFYILRGKHLEFAKKSFKIALVFGTLTTIATALAGHHQAQVVARTQPAKLAAFEGHFHTGEGGAPLHLIGWPNVKEERVDFGIAIPGGLSFLVHGDFSTPVPGLDQVKPEDQPPVRIPFLCFHTMVGLGVLMIGLTLLASFFLWRGTLFEKRKLMGVFVVAVVAPFLANQAGWVAAEVGRQPWVVQGLLRTANGYSHAVKGGQVLGSIFMFAFVYLSLFAVWVYVLHNKIAHGPDAVEPSTPEKTSTGDLLEAAARLANPAGYSLTDPDKE
jgi:cytochrome d ubiquinol oxidase subunit I